jgi:hypothetical protein
MNEAAFRAFLREVCDQMAAVPGPAAKNAPTGRYEPEVPQSTPDLADHLRMQVKYLLFDLEATRRENRYLRQMLESRYRDSDGPREA